MMFYNLNKNLRKKQKREYRKNRLPKKIFMVKKGSFKCCIGYISETNAFTILLRIKLPQMNGFAKYFDSSNKYINLFLVHDKEMLKNTM